MLPFVRLKLIDKYAYIFPTLLNVHMFLIINLMLGFTAEKIVFDAPDTGLEKICVHRDARIYNLNPQYFMLYSDMEALHVNDITSTDRYNYALVLPMRSTRKKLWH